MLLNEARMRAVWLFSLVVAAASLGCGSSGDGTSGSAPNPNELTFHTGSFDVTPGDSFTCFYTDTITDKEINVANTAGMQGPGGHHITVYYADTTTAPTHHPCKDSEMVSWHQIGGASNGGEPVVPLPDGAAIKVPAGKQIVVQAHYINTTGKTFTSDDSITLMLLPSNEVKQFMNSWVINDDAFTIPAQSTGTSVSTCTFPQDLKTVLLLGHMHDYGKHYKLERLDASGSVVETVYDHDWQPQYASHPPYITGTLDAPMDIKAGTTFRQTCTWDNTTPDPILFPREMCVAFGYYFPDSGWVYCDVKH
jgi:hypothetical protein